MTPCRGGTAIKLSADLFCRPAACGPKSSLSHRPANPRDLMSRPREKRQTKLASYLFLSNSIEETESRRRK